MKYLFFTLSFILSLFCSIASAEIFKTVNPDGRVTYSTVKSPNSKKLNLWTEIIRNEQFTYSSDTGSMTNSEKGYPVIGVDIITDNKTKQKTPLGSDYLSVVSRLEFDCKQSLYRVLRATFYEENDLKGNVILAIDGNPSSQWNSLKPPTILNAIQVYSCNEAFEIGVLKK